MAQWVQPENRSSKSVPYWSQMLRALREARGITQEGWGAQLGYSRATVRRWESGRTVPSADAERAIIALCAERRLFREFSEGPLLGVRVTSDWIADQLAMARLQTEEPQAASEDHGTALRIPPVSYASNGDVSLAYQTFGNGPVTFVITPGTISHRELEWENPAIRGFLLHLAQYGRVVIYDKRSTGLSDRVARGTGKDRINDLRAVMDAAGCDEVVLVGFTEGGPISIKFANTWPDRVKALVLYGTSAHVPNVSPETDAESYERIQRVWGTNESGFLEKFAPTARFNQREREWWARFQRMGASPGAIRDLNAMNATLNVHSLLPNVLAPTLIIHRAGDSVTPFKEAVHMSRIIPNARLVALKGIDHMAWAGDFREISEPIVEFASNLATTSSENIVLTTMMSISHTADISPDFWAIVTQLPSFGDVSEVRTDHHGSMLIFDSPSSAIRCATDLQAAFVNRDLGVGIGIHIGEILRKPHSISGDHVRLCVALADRASAGEVLVSESVKKLTADPSFTFENHAAPSQFTSVIGMELYRVKTEKIDKVCKHRNGGVM